MPTKRSLLRGLGIHKGDGEYERFTSIQSGVSYTPAPVLSCRKTPLIFLRGLRFPYDGYPRQDPLG